MVGCCQGGGPSIKGDRMKRWIVVSVAAMVLLCQSAFAGEAVTRSVTAENQWTTGIEPYSYSWRDTNKLGTLGIFVSGTFVATVSLQYSLDSGATWNDLYVNGTRKTYTGPTHDTLIDYEPGILYRIGVATGEFTSGTANVRLSK